MKQRLFGLAFTVSLAVVVGGLVLVKPVWADCDEPGQHDGCGDGWCMCCTGGGDTNCDCIGPCTLGETCEGANPKCNSADHACFDYNAPTCGDITIYNNYNLVLRDEFDSLDGWADWPGGDPMPMVSYCSDSGFGHEGGSEPCPTLQCPRTRQYICPMDMPQGNEKFCDTPAWTANYGFAHGIKQTSLTPPHCGTLLRGELARCEVDRGCGDRKKGGDYGCCDFCNGYQKDYTIVRELRNLSPGKTYYASVMAHGGFVSDKIKGQTQMTVTSGGVTLFEEHRGEEWDELTIPFTVGSDGTATIKLAGGTRDGKGSSGAFDQLLVYEASDPLPLGGATCPSGSNLGITVNARDDCGILRMRFSTDSGATWGEWVAYRSEAVLPFSISGDANSVQVQLEDLRGTPGNCGLFKTKVCGYTCNPVTTATVIGYVWEDANADGFSVGESKSKEATLYWDVWGESEITPVDGFNLPDVAPGNHKVYLDPKDCYCGTKWNNGSSADDYSTGFSDTNKFAPINNVLAGQTRYAYLGIQKAGFNVGLPSGTLVIDPAQEDVERRKVTVTVSKLNNCLNLTGVGLSAVIDPSGQGVSVIEIDPISVNIGDLPVEATVTLAVTPQSDYADEYTLIVTGTNDTCDLSASKRLKIKVEHVGWLQSRAGDIYGRGGITSYIPSDSAAFRSGFPSGDYLSLDNSDPGVVLSGGSTDSIELGLGGVSSENWKAESYHLGFFQSASGQFDYDFDYFQANLDASADCTLSSNGVLVDDHVCTGSVGVCDGAQTIVVSDCPVIKIEGNLDVDTPNLDGVRAVFLVSGNQLHFHADFAPEGYFAFIVNGNIAISTVVNNVRAILLASHTITDYIPWDEKAINWEDLPNGLLIRGEAIALGGFSLNRTRLGADGDVDSADDDLEAANFFDFDGALFLELQDLLGTPQYSWQELP